MGREANRLHPDDADKADKVHRESVAISHQAIRRLPYYHKYLKNLNLADEATVSAASMATDLRLYEVLVRKDLAAVSRTSGKPRVGFRVGDLIADIEHVLGFDNHDIAVLVGVGHLGKALLFYRGFEEYGLEIVAAFDCAKALQGKKIDGREVFPLGKMPNLCRRLRVRIGIVAVPQESAQEVCDLLVESGIRAIWNFAPTHLSVPEGILVQSENMAASLAILSKHLAEGAQP